MAFRWLLGAKQLANKHRYICCLDPEECSSTVRFHCDSEYCFQEHAPCVDAAPDQQVAKPPFRKCIEFLYLHISVLRRVSPKRRPLLLRDAEFQMSRQNLRPKACGLMLEAYMLYASIHFDHKSSLILHGRSGTGSNQSVRMES
jgi:hypothetical protein